MKKVIALAAGPLVAAGALAGCTIGGAETPEPFMNKGLTEDGIAYACPDGSSFLVYYDPLARDARIDMGGKMYQPAFKDQDGATYTYGGDTNGADVTLVVENGEMATLDVDGRTYGECVTASHAMAMAPAS